jgi:hypothetical protein
LGSPEEAKRRSVRFRLLEFFDFVKVYNGLLGIRFEIASSINSTSLEEWVVCAVSDGFVCVIGNALGAVVA